MGSIEVHELSKEFRAGRPVLDDVSFRYEGAGAIGYLGPNGAGKTTTLKLLVGLLRPSSGHALLNGIDPVLDRKAALWDVGAVIETPEPYPTRTVYETLETVGAMRGLSPESIDAEIDRCHEALQLPALDARCGWLSKGERQRVVLAASLIGDPPVLLLDEPTSGLDPAERVLVRRLLKQLRERHLLLMSSHQMIDVTEVCDQLMIVNRGRIVLRDRVDGVVARLATRQLEVEFSRPVQLSALSGLRPAPKEIHAVSDRRFRLSVEGGESGRAELLAGCQLVAPVVHFAAASLALEEAYLDAIAQANAS